MTTRQLIPLVLVFTIFVAVISAGTTYGMIQAIGGGPRGEQGLQGPTGATGATGPQGLKGATGNDGADATSSGGVGNILIAQSLALKLISDNNPGRTVKGSDSDVQACFKYLTEAEGSFTECGFTRSP